MPGRLRSQTGAMLAMAGCFAVAVAIGCANRSPDGEYAVAGIAACSRAVIVLGPMVAMWAAMRAATLAGYLTGQRPLRRDPVVMLAACMWPVAVGPIAAVGAVLSSARAVPTDAIPVAMLGVIAVEVLASGALGMAIGRALPPLIAVALAGGCTYGWLALVTSTDHATARYLTGSFATCCTVDEVPSTAMVTGSLAFTGLTAAGLVGTMLIRRPLPLRIGLVAAALVGAFAVSSVVVRLQDPEPPLLAVSDRTSEPECSTTGGIELCVWPEHADLLSTAGPVLVRARDRLARAGVPGVALRLSEVRDDHRAMYVQVAAAAQPADLILTLVTGMLPDPASCRYDPRERPDVYATYELARAWLAEKAGLGSRDLEARTDPRARRVLLKTLSTSERDQTSWYRDALAILSSRCGSRPL